MTTRYVIVTLDDAKHLAAAMNTYARLSAVTRPIVDRLNRETGADIEDLVARLKGAEVCAACGIEGQAAHCVALEAQKQGRRLRRLLERARGERKDEA